MAGEDPFSVLGIARSATATEVNDARRRLAKRVHPDLGGSASAMQRVNEAARAALEEIAGRAATDAAPSPGARRSSRRSSVAETARAQRRFGPQRVAHDHPSFVIEALPAVAFEALKLAITGIGTIHDDDPPYRLDARLDDPIIGWCRLNLLPEAGASTVSIEYSAMPGYPADSIETVRDAIIGELNQLDWSDLIP